MMRGNGTERNGLRAGRGRGGMKEGEGDRKKVMRVIKRPKIQIVNQRKKLLGFRSKNGQKWFFLCFPQLKVLCPSPYHSRWCPCLGHREESSVLFSV